MALVRSAPPCTRYRAHSTIPDETESNPSPSACNARMRLASRRTRKNKTGLRVQNHAVRRAISSGWPMVQDQSRTTRRRDEKAPELAIRIETHSGHLRLMGTPPGLAPRGARPGVGESRRDQAGGGQDFHGHRANPRSPRSRASLQPRPPQNGNDSTPVACAQCNRESTGETPDHRARAARGSCDTPGLQPSPWQCLYGLRLPHGHG